MTLNESFHHLTFYLPPTTLILHGTDDRVCLFDLAKKMKNDTKGSRLIQVEKAGRGFYYEWHDKVNSELVRFIG